MGMVDQRFDHMLRGAFAPAGPRAYFRSPSNRWSTMPIHHGPDQLLAEQTDEEELGLEGELGRDITAWIVRLDDQAAALPQPHDRRLVGKAQLDWKLRTDSRVELMEGVNARHIGPKDFPDRFDLVTVGVAFISLGKILPAVRELIRENGRILALVKPQFELTKEDVDSGGVVRDPDKHLRAVTQVMEAARQCGLAVEDVVASRLRGVEGNREFFLSLRPGPTGDARLEELRQRAKRACAPE